MGEVKKIQNILISDTLRMGELAVVKNDGCLKTLLGSCVGLALYCRHQPIGGLAHIVLPAALNRSGPPGKYVDTAIPELITQIENAGGCLPLKAKLAGGSNMLASKGRNLIGDQIVENLKMALKEFQIPIIGQHCGGSQGRRMYFWPRTGKVTIELVGGEQFDI